APGGADDAEDRERIARREQQRLGANAPDPAVAGIGFAALEREPLVWAEIKAVAFQVQPGVDGLADGQRYAEAVFVLGFQIVAFAAGSFFPGSPLSIW